MFTRLREISGLRRRHLHFFAPFTANARADALAAYRYLQVVLREVFEHSETDGRIQTNAPMEYFLKTYTKFMQPRAPSHGARARS